MKILFLSRPFSGKIKGTGEQVVAKNLYNNFVGNNVDLRHINSCFGVQAYKSIVSLLFYDWAYMFYVMVRSIFWKPDIIFFASPFQTSYICLTKIFFRRSITVVLVHDLFYRDYNKSYFDKYAKIMYRNSMNFANYIITTTEENSEKIKKEFDRAVEVIYLDVSDDFNSNINNTIIKEPGSCIGYIGAYSERKRVANIIDFFKTNKSQSFRFYFAGNMPNKFRKEIELYKGANEVFVKGIIRESEKVDFYNQLHYLYFPSRLEGFGLPILEAMKAGVVPIVHEDAEIPACLKKHCVKIENVNELDDIMNNFKENQDKFKDVVLKNLKYSRRFNLNNYYYFLNYIWKT